MRIKDVNLGGGLFRLEVEPTHCCENVHNVPTHVMDDIMRDVTRRVGNKQHNDCCNQSPRAERPWLNGMPRPMQKPMREADGIDIHLDLPRREMYGGWDAEIGYQRDLKKYRQLEQLAKECNWPCREPMKGAPQVPQTPQRCGCECEDDFEEELTLRDLLEELFGCL